MTTKQAAPLEKQVLPDFIAENEYFAVYPSEKMTLFVTRKPSPVLKGEFSHRNYEFVLSLSPISGFTVDGAPYAMPANALLPINSNQAHGTHLLISDLQFMNIQFEAEFIEALLFGIYGAKDVTFPNTVVPYGDEIFSLVHRFIDEYKQRREGYSYILSNLSIQIAIEIFRKIGVSAQITAQNPDEFVSRVIAHFSEHYEESFSLNALSKMNNMSKYNLARRFKDMTGKTPYAYLQDIRIMKALELLANPSNRVIDVAFQCGFKNHSHFTQLFRQRTALTPSEYRKRILKQS